LSEVAKEVLPFFEKMLGEAFEERFNLDKNTRNIPLYYQFEKEDLEPMDLTNLINLKLDLGNKIIDMEKNKLKDEEEKVIKKFYNSQLVLVDQQIKMFKY